MNAVAFSGSSYLFSMLGDNASAKEMERHNKAMEELSKAWDKWSQRRTEWLDFINEQLRRENQAVRVFGYIDQAMREYARITGNHLDPLGPEPQLSDFYTPSDGQKDRELVFIVLGIIATGGVAYYLSRN